jgi:tetratricopeptide (TPR) repeat protein
VAETTAAKAPAPEALVRQLVGAALRAGDVGEAERLLRTRLTRVPTDVDALVALADIVAQSGRIPEATALFHQALGLAPHAHGLRLQLSALHQQQSHFPIALKLLHEVPASERNSFDLKAREAALLGSLGRRDEEIAIYDQLLKDQPRNAGLWMTLGTALNYAGRTADAVTALRKATKLAPNFGEPWWSLANLKSFRFDERDLETMQARLRDNLAPIDALHFHFALGRAFEERKHFATSFDHYAAGNRLRVAGLNLGEVRVTGFVDAAIRTFTPELFDKNRGGGATSDAPIFIVGLQRSGSTLIEQILASHPAIEATSELMAMQHLWEEHVARSGGSDPFAMLDKLTPEAFTAIGEEYLARTSAFRQLGRPRFIDKLPANWMNLGLIRLALPNAKIIDARRHPLGSGWSNFKQHYATGVTFSYSLDSIGNFYADYIRMMRHFDAVQPGAVLHVMHENLVEDPEAEIRRMLMFLGLEFDPVCLDFHKSTRAVQTPSAEQVRRPITKDGLEAWRSYEPWLDPLKQALGPLLDDWQR